MPELKKVFEVFSAGCPVCSDIVEEIRKRACPTCEVKVLNIKDPKVAARAKSLGIRSIPAVAVDGVLAGCCADRGVDISELERLGLGKENCCG